MVAVTRFLDGTLGFTGIPALLEAAVERFAEPRAGSGRRRARAVDGAVADAFTTIPFGAPA
jgi:hypothetical protein